MTHAANVNHYVGVRKIKDLFVGFNLSCLVVLQNQTNCSNLKAQFESLKQCFIRNDVNYEVRLWKKIRHERLWCQPKSKCNDGISKTVNHQMKGIFVFNVQSASEAHHEKGIPSMLIILTLRTIKSNLQKPKICSRIFLNLDFLIMYTKKYSNPPSRCLFLMTLSSILGNGYREPGFQRHDNYTSDWWT